MKHKNFTRSSSKNRGSTSCCNNNAEFQRSQTCEDSKKLSVNCSASSLLSNHSNRSWRWKTDHMKMELDLPPNDNEIEGVHVAHNLFDSIFWKWKKIQQHPFCAAVHLKCTAIHGVQFLVCYRSCGCLWLPKQNTPTHQSVCAVRIQKAMTWHTVISVECNIFEMVKWQIAAIAHRCVHDDGAD